MRDMSVVIGANVANGATTLPLTSLTPEQELTTRVRLSQSLQMSLDPADVLRAFFKHIQSLVSVSGLLFKSASSLDDFTIGRECLHHCDYRLTTDEGYLGEVIFNRSKRFADAELHTLEFLLGSLVYPLRNAIRYQTAMRLALLDPLTLLGNRAALDTALLREFQMADRYHYDFSLLMIDVDFFKRINDTYGHHCGDLVLCEIAKAIQSVCRGTDMSFRYGGEEFVVVLSKTNAEGAMVIAERIRQQIDQTPVKLNGQSISTSVSIGTATRSADQKEQLKEIFERADNALYRAKANGRNCVICGNKMPVAI